MIELKKNIDGSQIERSHAIAELVMNFFKQHSLCATCVNYLVVYEYFHNRDLALVSAFDEMISAELRVTDSALYALYTRFLKYSPTPELAKLLDKPTKEESVDDGVKVSQEITVEEGSSLGDQSSFSLGSSKQQLLHRIVRVVVDEYGGKNKKLAVNLRQERQKNKNLGERLSEVRLESMTDALTGLLNRRGYDVFIHQYIEDAQDTRAKMCLMLIDVDNFKAQNDTFGHIAGDGILRYLGDTLLKEFKGRDIAVRLGGDEFGVLMHDISLENAYKIGDSLRKVVYNDRVTGAYEGDQGSSVKPITLSIGVASMNATDNESSLFDRADACLYNSKRLGKNHITSETELTNEELKQHQNF